MVALHHSRRLLDERVQCEQQRRSQQQLDDVGWDSRPSLIPPTAKPSSYAKVVQVDGRNK